MADYERWNSALIEYFVEGTPAGALVFLSADDETVALVGHLLRRAADGADEAAPADAIVRDFCEAVRARVVRGGRVDLAAVQGSDARGRPLCAAFLCALVLAASRMADEEDREGNDFFTPLRDVFGLPGRGRPEGMRSGRESEEPLWNAWNFWLQVNGRLPSTRADSKGALRYIGYARSQALLRRIDREQLIDKVFADLPSRREIDADTLFARVRRAAPYLTTHLREDLLGVDSQRQRAVADAVHQLYEEWRLDPAGAVTGSTRLRGHTLYAGLYREADPLTGDVAYHLYPRAPRGTTRAELRALLPDGTARLRPERPGRFRPLGAIDGATLCDGAHYPIEQPAEVDEVVLPRRPFWLLVPDPENPESGVYATWGRPDLGVPFILLCNADALAQVRALERERLLTWREEANVLDGAWVELRDCLVYSEAWSTTHAADAELYEALRPAERCSVSLSSGLRLPEGGGWLEDFGPQLTVFGFGDEAAVTVTRLAADGTERLVLEATQPVSEPQPFPWPGIGTYRVAAACAGQEAPPRLVQIVSWDGLRPAAEPPRQTLALAGARICGAAVD
jgi:hypothetical protein